MVCFLSWKAAEWTLGLFRPFAVSLVAGIIFYLLPGVSGCWALEEEFFSFPWRMEADRITHLQNKDQMLGEGNVILRRMDIEGLEPLEIKAQRIDYGLGSGEIEATGGLEVRMGRDLITADQAVLDLNKQTGRLSNTTIYLADHNLYFSGSIVEKIGEFSYRFEKSRITSCSVPPDRSAPWGIRARKTDLTMDGYATLRHATFRIKDVPVFYAPYLILPAKVSRQTGFLFPEISNSQRDGIGFLTPFFVNLSPSLDFTIMPGNLSERGPLLGVEFRYAAGMSSMGSFTIQYQQDRTEDSVADDYKSDGYLRKDHDRYWLRGKADHQFGSKIQARLDVDLVSDPDFLQEFRDGMLGFDDSQAGFLNLFRRGLQEETIPFRESTLQLMRVWPAAFLGGELRGVDDTNYRLPDEEEGDSALHTLPRLLLQGRASLANSLLGWKWDSEYDYFWREDGLGSHRLDTRPALSASLPLGPYFEGRIEGGLRETIYQVEQHGDGVSQWENSHHLERTLFSGSLRFGGLLFRDFSWENKGRHMLRHLIRPSLGYDFRSQDDQNNLPDFDNLDRLERKNDLQLALHQYFTIKNVWPDGSIDQRELGFIKITQNYDLHEARRKPIGEDEARRPFSDIFFDLDLRPMKSLHFRYKTALDVYGNGVPEYEFRTRYYGRAGNLLSLDYRYERGILHELNLSLGARLMDSFFVQLGTTRSLVTDHTVKENLRIMYHPHCWSMEIEASRTEEDERVMLLFSLDGIGKVFEWGREKSY